MKWRVFIGNESKTFRNEQKAYEYYNESREYNPHLEHYVEEPLGITFIRDLIYGAKIRLRNRKNRTSIRL